MASLNKVILIGHMVADPELKQTTSGVNVCSFTIGVSRKYTKSADTDRATLSEISRYEVSLLSPCDDIKKVGLRLLAFRVSAAHTDSEGTDTDTGRSLLQLRISHHMTDQNNFVQACHSIHLSLSQALVVMERITPSVMLKMRSSSATKLGSAV